MTVKEMTDRARSGGYWTVDQPRLNALADAIDALDARTAPRTVYVDGERGNDANSSDSAKDAKKTVAAATAPAPPADARGEDVCVLSNNPCGLMIHNAASHDTTYVYCESKEDAARGALAINNYTAALRQRCEAAEADLVKEETQHAATLAERDRLSDMLDAFVTEMGGVETCGEHSNMNDPWDNALELAADAIRERDDLRKKYADVVRLLPGQGNLVDINWRNNLYVGQQSEWAFWVRHTDSGGIYWWFHPSTGWVSEPNQIEQPKFQTRGEAYHAKETCSPPPEFRDAGPPPPRSVRSAEEVALPDDDEPGMNEWIAWLDSLLRSKMQPSPKGLRRMLDAITRDREGR
jgi:hypothetical protein